MMKEVSSSSSPAGRGYEHTAGAVEIYQETVGDPGELDVVVHLLIRDVRYDLHTDRSVTLLDLEL